jgi:outer membrane protein assembly factor BamB
LRIRASFGVLLLATGAFAVLFILTACQSTNRGTQKTEKAVDSSLPKEKWHLDLGGWFNGLAVGLDGTVYVAGRQQLYAISPDGVVKWKFTSMPEPISTAPVVGPDGGIYLGTVYGGFFAVNSDGTQRWKSSWHIIGIGAPPALSDNAMLYVGNTVSDLFAYDSRDGVTPTWHVDTTRLGTGVLPGRADINQHSRCSPVIGGDGSVFLGRQQWLNAFSSSGEILWTLALSFSDLGDAAIGPDGTIYVAGGVSDYKLYAVGPDGQKKWDFPTTGNIVGSPAIDRAGTIYLATRDRGLFALQPDGTLAWRITTRGYATTSPTLASDGTIYFGVDSNLLVAARPDGTQKWEFPTKGDVSPSPAISPDGTIYAVTGYGRVYALVDSGAGLMQSSWPKWQHDSRNSGQAKLLY